MDRFVRGCFGLAENITNLEEFEATHMKQLEKIGEFCNMFDIEFQCGTTESNYYVIEYRIISTTAQRCNSLYKELKDTIKEYFGKPVEFNQIKGRLW